MGDRIGKSTMRNAVLLLALAVPLFGCSNMSATQQRAVTGTGIGAAGGAVIGAIAGNAGLGAGIGAVAGLAGGLLYDQVKKDQASQYEKGYNAGRSGQAPTPPQ